jgi:asparagine synthetase B (glutamine-hydrolysing)
VKRSAVRVRVSLRPDGSRLAILFSGGIDSMMLAALAHR